MGIKYALGIFVLQLWPYDEEDVKLKSFKPGRLGTGLLLSKIGQNLPTCPFPWYGCPGSLFSSHLFHILHKVNLLFWKLTHQNHNAKPNYKTALCYYMFQTVRVSFSLLHDSVKLDYTVKFSWSSTSTTLALFPELGCQLSSGFTVLVLTWQLLAVFKHGYVQGQNKMLGDRHVAGNSSQCWTTVKKWEVENSLQQRSGRQREGMRELFSSTSSPLKLFSDQFAFGSARFGITK